MSLGSLPVEIIMHIATVASFPSAAALSRTSRSFHDIVNPILYKREIAIQDEDEPGKKSLSGPKWDSCIIWAARNGHLETIKLAHEKYGASLEDRGWARVDDRGDGIGRGNALYIAIIRLDMIMVKYLLEKGVDVNTAVEDRCPNCLRHLRRLWPLHTPIIHGHIVDSDPLAELLIRHGARSVTRENDILTVLVRHGRLDLLDLLLKQPETSPYETFGVHRETAIHEVSRLTNDALGEEMALKLIDFGVPINHLDSSDERKSALRLALERGRYTIAKLLLSHGADTTVDFTGPVIRRDGTWLDILQKRELSTFKGYCDRKDVIKSLTELGHDMGDLLVNEENEYVECDSSGRKVIVFRDTANFI